MSRFDKDTTMERFGSRLDAPTLRVKIWRQHTPTEVEEDGNRLVFEAAALASRFGNREWKQDFREDPEAELALVADMQGLYYKSAVGLLAVRDTITPVRLETYNTDGTTGLPAVQHALIDTREHSEHGLQIKFR